MSQTRISYIELGISKVSDKEIKKIERILLAAIAKRSAKLRELVSGEQVA